MSPATASREYLPYIFSIITLRQERSGGLLYNPYLDLELRLDPVEWYIVGLFNGRDSCDRIGRHASKKFGFTARECSIRIFLVMGRLSEAMALGFNEAPARLRPPKRIGYKFFKNGPFLAAPKMVTWEATYACNLHCPHCYNEAGDARGNELDTRQAFALIDRLEDAGVLRLLVSGGEPLLRPDILPILRRISRSGMRFDIATNGLELPKKILDGISRMPLFHVHVSIDGMGKTHDRFRGHSGAFEAACRNILRLREKDIAVSLSMTVTRENTDELERVIDLALELGCRGFFANAIMPTGRGRKNAGRYMLDEEGYYRLYKTLVEKGSELNDRLSISTDMCFPFLFSKPGTTGVSQGHMGCSAGSDTLCVGADGTAYPCHMLRDFPLGNVLEKGINAIWNNSPTLNDLRRLRKEDMAMPCRNCRYAPEICHGGCRAAAYLVRGDLRESDATCFILLAERRGST